MSTLPSVPASSGQERLWRRTRQFPQDVIYNIPCIYRFRGTLDIGALERAFGEVVRRHEALRTVFAEMNQQVVQVILPELVIELPVRDLTGLGAAERKAEVDAILDAEAHQPFDLTRGPLIRAHAVRVAADDHYLLFSVHHIVFDGWSMQILFEELSALYRAYRTGEPAALPEPSAQYREYATWQHEYVRTPAHARQLEYWRRQHAGGPAPPLPTDWPRPADGASTNARTIVKKFPAGLDKKLENVARELNATLFMVMFSAYAILLQRYSQQSDVCIGSPTIGRWRQEWLEVIGRFSNTMPLRVNLSGMSTFREVLNRVRELVLDAMMHQDVSFERLAEEVLPRQNKGNSRLYHTMLIMHTGISAADGAPLQLADAQSESVQIEFDGSMHDLKLTIGGDDLELQYRSDLYSPASADAMLECFLDLLDRIVADSSLQISDLPLGEWTKWLPFRPV